MSREASVSKYTDFNWIIGVQIVVGSLDLCKPVAGVSTLLSSDYCRLVTECSVLFGTKRVKLYGVE